MADSKIHPSNLVYLAISLFGIIAFFLVAIYPNLKVLERMDEEISALNLKADRQTLLHPVFIKLLKEVTQTIPTKLPTPEKRKISHNDLSQINERFLKLALESRVAFIRAVPDASNYLEDMGYLTMNVVFSGDFFNFQKLLLGICQMPFLESIDEMRIETINQEKRISFRLKIEQE